MTFYRLVAVLAQYGSQFVGWALTNRRTVERWLVMGVPALVIADLIRRALGG